MTSMAVTTPHSNESKQFKGVVVRFRSDPASYGRCDDVLRMTYGSFLVREYIDGPFVNEDGMVVTVVRESQVEQLERHLKTAERARDITYLSVYAVAEDPVFRILSVVS